jgi:hypothetical protein
MVIDYHTVNRITIPGRQPLPHAHDMLDRPHAAPMPDLDGIYHEVRVREEDVSKTAFRNPFGFI